MGNVQKTQLPIAALSPLDGRYADQIAPLTAYFSEFALNRTRLHVEVEWIIALCGGPDSTGQVRQPLLNGAPVLDTELVNSLRAIPERFDDAEAIHLADIEATTRHDIKAIEYYLGEKTSKPRALNPGLIHFALTSDDVNNLAYALNIKAALQNVWQPSAEQLVAAILTLSQITADSPMLSRTHGQPATPTTLGKELAIFVSRLRRQLARISKTEFLGKFSGATGTYSAHVIAAPYTDWPAAAKHFVESLGLTFNPLTTQIESHDWQSELYDDISRFNRILHNFCTDIWTYISLGYFSQHQPAGSIGSSTMPHKINPIRFENAEANLEISNGMLQTISATLSTSRLQRDLTDSTTQRNIGVGFGHSLVAIKNVIAGLKTLSPNESKMAQDLDSNWEVLAEPIQMVMRAASIAGATGLENPYEKLKELTRGNQVTKADLHTGVKKLGLPKADSARLLELTPATYTGLAANLARTVI
jgi:adenylosuccinate lyase